MPMSRARAVKRVAVAAVLIVGGAGSMAAFAQGGPALLDFVVTLLQRIRTDIGAVQASVDEVQASVDALGATSSRAYTSTVIVESGILDCTASNVADADREIRIRVVNATTGADIFALTSTVQPGRAYTVGLLAPSAFSGRAYCAFDVLDGTKADIRASLLMTPNIGGVETSALSVPAE